MNKVNNEKKVVVKKLVLKKKVKNFIIRAMLVTIVFLSTLIFVRQNNSFKNNVIKYVFEDSFEFAKLKSLYEKYFGKVLSVDKIIPKEEKVFNEKLNYKSKNAYKDGVALTVDKNYMVPSIESGIVVFMGEKEGYGNTIIIEGVNGIDIWYSNVNTENIKMYDYIEKGKLIGEVKNNKLYMVFQKEGKYLDYKEYI